MVLFLIVLNVCLSVTHIFLPALTLILLLTNAVKMSVTQINAASERSIQNNAMMSQYFPDKFCSK